MDTNSTAQGATENTKVVVDTTATGSTETTQDQGIPEVKEEPKPEEKPQVQEKVQAVPVVKVNGTKKWMTVAQCTKMHKGSDIRNEVVGYKLKIVYDDVISQMTGFGESSRPVKETYYLDTKTPSPIGAGAWIDLACFDIKITEWVIDSGEKKGETATLKNLVAKRP